MSQVNDRRHHPESPYFYSALNPENPLTQEESPATLQGLLYSDQILHSRDHLNYTFAYHFLYPEYLYSTFVSYRSPQSLLKSSYSVQRMIFKRSRVTGL